MLTNNLIDKICQHPYDPDPIGVFWQTADIEEGYLLDDIPYSYTVCTLRETLEAMRKMPITYLHVFALREHGNETAFEWGVKRT